MDLNAGNLFERDEWECVCLLGTVLRCFSVADMHADGSYFCRLDKQIIIAVLEEAVAEPK